MMIRRSIPHVEGLPDHVTRARKMSIGLPETQRPSSALERFAMSWLGIGAPRSVAVPILWLRRWRYRQELANLSERQLRDVGLNPEMVRRESTKPFWLA